MDTVTEHELLTPYDIYLFKEGKHLKLHEKLGSHPTQVDGKDGTHFAVWAPNAKHVSVIGDFNDWRPGSIALEDQDHDGVWRATIVLPEGTYEYMFVVDGERWVPDHLAERLVADDFGRENSVVIVRAARR